VLTGPVIVAASFLYLLLLFAVAYFGDKRADAGRSVIANPTIYALSLAVYCTTWTYYGSVGRAASSGLGFVPIFLGPTLAVALWWFVMLKMVRIGKTNRITSIADFIASRYGKSHLLGGLVTVIAVLGVIPYIALQLKALSVSFAILVPPDDVVSAGRGALPWLADTTFYVALSMAAFTILFGTRHLDATERHEGWWRRSPSSRWSSWWLSWRWGFCHLRSLRRVWRSLLPGRPRAPVAGPDAHGGGRQRLRQLVCADPAVDAGGDVPAPPVSGDGGRERQREPSAAGDLAVSSVSAADQRVRAADRAGRLMSFAGQQVDADTFVLRLPMVFGHDWLALVVFIGGLSAATGMIVVETIALSTMVCNDLVMPLLLRYRWLALQGQEDVSGVLLGIRRGAIVLILLLAYLYFRLAGRPMRW
jgi:hypothetical protein